MSLGKLIVVSVLFECIALISKVEFKVDKFINFDVVGTDMNNCVIGISVFRCKINRGIGNSSFLVKFIERVFRANQTRVLASALEIIVSASDRCVEF